MEKVINKIDKNNLDSLLVNVGQSKMSKAMVDFANTVPDINTIEDLRWLDRLFYNYFTKDNSTKKFECTAEQIFDRRTFSGCSDIGLAISPILRYKGIPTIYVESASIEWIKDVQEDNENKELMRGHIFLEIYLNNKWYLYDPTFHLVYGDYDYNNLCLPRDYYVFAKGMNSFDIGVHSVKNEKELATNVLKDFDITSYTNLNYNKYDLRR